MRFRFHADAALEIEEATRWYAEHGSGLAQAFLDELDRALEIVLEGPAVWPLVPRVPGRLKFRRYLVRRFPYAVCYREAANEIQIVAVAHLKRKPGYWVKRV